MESKKKLFARNRETAGERIFYAVNALVLALLCVLLFYPFLYVVFASFSDPVRFAMHSGGLLVPLGFDAGAYKQVFANPNILLGYKNTLFNLIVGTAMQMLFTCPAAYVLSRKGYMWKKVLSLFVIFTMFFNGGLIPTYLQITALGIDNTRWAMILPKLIITFNLIILRTAFESVSESLEESARLDGANDFHVLLNVVLPLSKPTLAIIVLYYAVGHWNAWFSAMLYLQKRELYPLQLILREILFMSANSGTSAVTNMYTDTVKYASIVVATLPILAVYPFVQKYFVKGMMVGAIKG